MYVGRYSFNLYNDREDVRIFEPVFECDELIAPVISILNRKGYKTQFCCSGHVNSRSLYKDDLQRCYIMFNYKKDLLLESGFTMPDGFEFDEDPYINDSTVIEHYYSKYYDWIEILDTMKALYKWAEQLDNSTI